MMISFGLIGLNQNEVYSQNYNKMSRDLMSKDVPDYKIAELVRIQKFLNNSAFENTQLFSDIKKELYKSITQALEAPNHASANTILNNTLTHIDSVIPYKNGSFHYNGPNYSLEIKYDEIHDKIHGVNFSKEGTYTSYKGEEEARKGLQEFDKINRAETDALERYPEGYSYYPNSNSGKFNFQNQQYQQQFIKEII
jgi:hypothetical protein